MRDTFFETSYAPDIFIFEHFLSETKIKDPVKMEEFIDHSFGLTEIIIDEDEEKTVESHFFKKREGIENSNYLIEKSSEETEPVVLTIKDALASKKGLRSYLENNSKDFSNLHKSLDKLSIGIKKYGKRDKNIKEMFDFFRQ